MGWGSSWDKPVNEYPKSSWPDWPKNDPENIKEEFVGVTPELLGVKPIEIRSYDNKFPTHDPYTNPGAFLYYECECGQVLNPKVKSFASLNNHASNAGWKIRWGEKHYVPYCPKCAVEKGIE